VFNPSMSTVVTVLRLYGINTLMLTTFPAVFTDVYHLSRGNLGLVYIGPGVGYVIGAIFGAQMSNKVYNMVSIIFHHRFIYLFIIL
jgi:predicted MFS family arabinose efflux permease